MPAAMESVEGDSAAFSGGGFAAGAPAIAASFRGANMEQTFADMQSAQAPADGPAPLSGPVIIKDGSMTAEVFSVEKAIEAVRAAVAALGGDVSSSSTYTDQYLVARIKDARAAPGGAEKTPPCAGATSANLQVGLPSLRTAA